jgi:hypothetical protein
VPAASVVMISTLKKAAASIAVLAALAYSLAWAVYLWDHRTIGVTLAADSTIPPTESQAVQVTRDAMSLARLDTEGFDSGGHHAASVCGTTLFAATGGPRR